MGHCCFHYLDVMVGNFALADPEAAGGIRVKSGPRPPQPPREAPTGTGFVTGRLPHRSGFVKNFRR